MCSKKIISLYLNQNVCCEYSKQPSRWDGSFEHPKHMLKMMGKKIFTIVRGNFAYLNLRTIANFLWKHMLIKTYAVLCVWIFNLFLIFSVRNLIKQILDGFEKNPKMFPYHAKITQISSKYIIIIRPGHIAQLVVCLTANPGVMSSIRSHTFV